MKINAVGFKERVLPLRCVEVGVGDVVDFGLDGASNLEYSIAR